MRVVLLALAGLVLAGSSRLGRTRSRGWRVWRSAPPAVSASASARSPRRAPGSRLVSTSKPWSGPVRPVTPCGWTAFSAVTPGCRRRAACRSTSRSVACGGVVGGARPASACASALPVTPLWRRARPGHADAASRRPSAALRRPLPYRNFGMADAERVLARRGLRLFATVKSASLVTTTPGPWWEEVAAPRPRPRAGGRGAPRAGADCGGHGHRHPDRRSQQPARRDRPGSAARRRVPRGGDLGRQCRHLAGAADVAPACDGHGRQGRHAVAGDGPARVRGRRGRRCLRGPRRDGGGGRHCRALVGHPGVGHAGARGRRRAATHPRPTVLARRRMRPLVRRRRHAGRVRVALAGAGASRRLPRRSRWRQALLGPGAILGATLADRAGAAADHRPMVPRGHRGRAHRQRARRARDGRGAGGRSRAPSGRECLARRSDRSSASWRRTACASLLRSADVVAVAPWLVREVPPPVVGRARRYYYGAHGRCRRARTRDMPRCRLVRRSRTAKAECRECRTSGQRGRRSPTAAGACVRRWRWGAWCGSCGVAWSTACRRRGRGRRRSGGSGRVGPRSHGSSSRCSTSGRATPPSCAFRRGARGSSMPVAARPTPSTRASGSPRRPCGRSDTDGSIACS